MPKKARGGATTGPRGQRRSLRANALQSHDYYLELGSDQEPHPIDEAIEQRLPHRALRRAIRAAADELVAALEDRRMLWLKLEELIANYRLDREAAYFNLGYAHGLIAGHAEALALSKEDRRSVADQIRRLIINEGLSPQCAAMTLLETAWALLRGHEHRSSTRVSERGQTGRR